MNESHGAVEVNALQQTRDINARGVYKVGKLQGKQPKVRSLMYNDLKVMCSSSFLLAKGKTKFESVLIANHIFSTVLEKF